MAMLPFCGYNMADYLAHWLEVGRREGAQLPRVFYVNWFRKDDDGKFLWPGFGENSRVLEWVFRRANGEGAAHDTPFGLVPAASDLDTDGLDIAAADLDELLRVDHDVWREEASLIPAFFDRFGDRLPAALWNQHAALVKRLG